MLVRSYMSCYCHHDNVGPVCLTLVRSYGSYPRVTCPYHVDGLFGKHTVVVEVVVVVVVESYEKKVLLDQE